MRDRDGLYGTRSHTTTSPSHFPPSLYSYPTDTVMSPTRVFVLFCECSRFEGKTNGACGNRHTPLVAMKYNRQDGAGNPLEVGRGGEGRRGGWGGAWGIERPEAATWLATWGVCVYVCVCTW